MYLDKYVLVCVVVCSMCLLGPPAIILLENGAKVNAKATDETGQSISILEYVLRKFLSSEAAEDQL